MGQPVFRRKETGDFYFDVARGAYGYVSGVNKFGRSTNVDSSTDTDLHDGANSTDNVDIWVAPTAARNHTIVSSDDNDGKTGAPSSTGARTIEIFGLTSWDSEEVSETITLDGTTGVTTTNDYVIIHRMRVLTKGGTNVNIGKITATAATDGTVTAQINAGEGQTQMAIYGVPSTQDFYCTHYYADVNKATATGNCSIKLLQNPEPDAELTQFVTKHTRSCIFSGSSEFTHHFQPYNKFSGPCILKVQANGSANDLDVSGGFEGFVVNK